jgi:hypothetical protein
VDTARARRGEYASAMTTITDMSNAEYEDFFRAIKENEAAIGILNERMKAIQTDPLQHNKAGAAEYWCLFDQTKPFSLQIDAAWAKLSASEFRTAYAARK